MSVYVRLAGSGHLQIRRVIPSGEDVPPGQQIVIEFDRPMVPIGRMARDPHEMPITVTPARDWLRLD